MKPEMTAGDVVAFLGLMQANEVHVWIDGGWAVDACLGAQTRRHADLDIISEERHAAIADQALRRMGYGPVSRDDTRRWNYVLGDGAGHEIDFHVIVLDAGGNGIYGPRQNGDIWPA